MTPVSLEQDRTAIGNGIPIFQALHAMLLEANRRRLVKQPHSNEHSGFMLHP